MNLSRRGRSLPAGTGGAVLADYTTLILEDTMTVDMTFQKLKETNPKQERAEIAALAITTHGGTIEDAIGLVRKELCLLHSEWELKSAVAR